MKQLKLMLLFYVLWIGMAYSLEPEPEPKVHSAATGCVHTGTTYAKAFTRWKIIKQTDVFRI